MSPDDEEGPLEPEPVGGPVPQPSQRPWMHPSELQTFVAAPTADPRLARPREWAIGLGSAVAAALLTVLVLVAFGDLGGGTRPSADLPQLVGQPSVVDYAVARRVAADTVPSIVTLRVVGGDGRVAPVGSGVVVGTNRVMTNAHLVAGTTDLDVVTSEGRPYAAKVVGTDPQTDLALLAVSGAELVAVAQGETADVGVGTPVIAVAANRAGAYRTGIDVISDRNRLIDAGSGATVAGTIETGIEAGIAWAGGALVDSVGNLVGVLTEARDAPELGLVAIPLAAVRDVLGQLESSGEVRHGWLGVVFGDDAVERPRGGARVAVVMPGSPAAKGGLEAGDVVTHVGDTAVGGRADAIAAVRALRPQDPIEIGYVDPGGQTHRPRVTLAAPDPPALANLPGSG